VSAEAPTDPKAREEPLFSALRGEDIERYPRYFGPYRIDSVSERLRPYAELAQRAPVHDAELRRIADRNGGADALVRQHDLTAIVRRDDARIIAMLPISPWRRRHHSSIEDGAVQGSVWAQQLRGHARMHLQNPAQISFAIAFEPRIDHAHDTVLLAEWADLAVRFRCAPASRPEMHRQSPERPPIHVQAFLGKVHTAAVADELTPRTMRRDYRYRRAHGDRLDATHADCGLGKVVEHGIAGADLLDPLVAIDATARRRVAVRKGLSAKRPGGRQSARTAARVV
jgi:hypothetical protein